MMFTIAQTMTLRKYKVYDSAEFVAIARRILGEGRRDDWQHTQFKIHTGDGIIPCFKDCVGSDYANIDQMSMRDAAKVLLWCDNLAVNLKPQVKIEPVPPNPLSTPHEVVTNNHFSEPGFVEKYAYHYDKLDYFHFDNLARALDVNDRYTIIGARTGGIIECVNKIGLKNVSYYDPSSECRDYIQKKYNIACVESYNINLNKLIIFDMTSRDPTIVYRCVQGGGNVLVYDSQPYYPGCLSLKRCGQTLDYRYATNFGFYRTNAVDMSAAVTTLVSINPDTLCKVDTVYVHTDCESAMVFLKVVDPGRHYNYRFFGPLANELNVKHRCSKKERSGRCLFVIGKEAGYVKDLYHANDIVYSLPLDRELDNGFLNECLPLLGETTLYEISRLGFIAQDFILYDCDYARGFVTTVNSEPILAVNRWYYMRQTVDIRYYTRDNVYDPGAVKIKDAIFGFIRFRVSRPGYIRYSCDATHGQFFQHHIHIAKVAVNPDFHHSTRMYIRGSDLSNKPCLLNLETIHSDREDHLAYYRDLALMCASDTEVVINGSWLYNPRGHSHIDARDLTKIADFCLCKGISVEDFMVTVFKLDIVYTDVDGEWVFNRIRALSVTESPDYIYCNGDVARDNYSYFGSGPILLYDKRSDCAFISVLLYCRLVPLEMSQEINV